MGKKVLIPTEEIELYQYEQTAPGAYYAMMGEKLKLLKDSGVTFCGHNDLEHIFKGSCPNPVCPKEEPNITKERKKVKIDKRIITESDLKKLTGDGINCICINCNTILTDLAKDYLKNRKIEIEREPSTGRKQG